MQAKSKFVTKIISDLNQKKEMNDLEDLEELLTSDKKEKKVLKMEIIYLLLVKSI